MAVAQKWVARETVPHPTRGRAPPGWYGARERCWKQQSELRFLVEDGLELCSGPGSAHHLLMMAAGKMPLVKTGRWLHDLEPGAAVRIPTRYLDALVRGGITGQGPDPGSPVGYGENFVFIVPVPSRPYVTVTCLVHGTRERKAPGFDALTPRQQLVELGVTDPEILAKAWDVVPAPALFDDRLFQGAGIVVLSALCIPVLRRARRRFKRRGMRMAARPASGHCPACASREGPVEWVSCPSCDMAHHLQCWDYLGGCSIFGCTQGEPRPGGAGAPEKKGEDALRRP